MPKRIDLTGRKFGRLTAVEMTDKRNRNGSIYWKCRCDCGRETFVTSDVLRRGAVKSCGCLQRENRKKITDQLHRVEGTCIEFLNNRKTRRDNTSGCRGVYLLRSGRYRADIGFQGKKYQLGTFDRFDEAVAARMEAEDLVYGGFLKAYGAWKKANGQAPDEEPFVFEVYKQDGRLQVHSNF